MTRFMLLILLLTIGMYSPPALCADSVLLELVPYKGTRAKGVDATTLKGKVMAGYQGWFSVRGDGVRDAWFHWTYDQQRITADNVTVDLWPDMSDYPKSEWYPASNMKHKDGRQAYLFSSCKPTVVDMHFKWMKQYGIDGVFVQRFIGEGGDPNNLETTGVLAYSRNAANKYGRVISITYDLSGAPNDKVVEALKNDWKFLVDKMKLTQDKSYLRHNGKPVLSIYGFFPDRFSPKIANEIIDFFKDDPKYGTFLIGSGAWWWREIADPGWPEVYRRFDACTPWNVGNHMLPKNGKTKMATTNYWSADVKECRKNGIMYMPVAYPGFSWDNLQTHCGNKEHVVGSGLPRRKGQFLWEQFVTATKIGADAIFVAMFDEVDEGTAIFKVTNDPPVGRFLTYEGKPSDWYLRVVGAGKRMYCGKAPLRGTVPEKP